MAEEMRDANLIVSRAGSTTLAELAAAGRAAILIPLPTATDDHQRRNADALARAPLGPMKRHHNRRHTGSAERVWMDLIPKHGPYRRGLMLGCSGLADERRILEGNPGTHWTICDIAPGSLQLRLEHFGPNYGGLIELQESDLNFVSLEAEAYDLIVSAATLHHVVNLEHVADQINRALTADGRFYFNDYTGESGFRFPDRQRRMFEVLYERERARHPNAGLPDIVWRNVDGGTYSPFEAIRSADTVVVLRQFLREESNATHSSVMGLLFFSGTAEQYRRTTGQGSWVDRVRGRSSSGADQLVWEEMLSAEFFAELALADEIICDAGFFPPVSTFAVYRKK